MFSLQLHQAFPSISTGVYSYPVRDATRIAVNEVRTFLESEHGNEVSTFLLFFLRLIWKIWNSSRESYLWCGVIRIGPCMSEYPPLFFCWPHPSSNNSTDRSLIPKYFPPGEKVEGPEPVAELSESDDDTEPSEWQLDGFVLSLVIFQRWKIHRAVILSCPQCLYFVL